MKEDAGLTMPLLSSRPFASTAAIFPAKRLRSSLSLGDRLTFDPQSLDLTLLAVFVTWHKCPAGCIAVMHATTPVGVLNSAHLEHCSLSQPSRCLRRLFDRGKNRDDGHVS